MGFMWSVVGCICVLAIVFACIYGCLDGRRLIGDMGERRSHRLQIRESTKLKLKQMDLEIAREQRQLAEAEITRFDRRPHVV